MWSSGISATVAPLARSAMILMRRCPRRSTSVPPKKPATTEGNAIKNPTSPVLVALPVVTKTNQGTATIVMLFPTRDTALASRNA